MSIIIISNYIHILLILLIIIFLSDKILHNITTNKLVIRHFFIFVRNEEKDLNLYVVRAEGPTKIFLYFDVQWIFNLSFLLFQIFKHMIIVVIILIGFSCLDIVQTIFFM